MSSLSEKYSNSLVFLVNREGTLMVLTVRFTGSNMAPIFKQHVVLIPEYFRTLLKASWAVAVCDKSTIKVMRHWNYTYDAAHKGLKAGFSHPSALAVAHIIAGPAECLGVTTGAPGTTAELAACSLPFRGVSQCLCLCAREGKAKPQSCFQNHSNHSPCFGTDS